MLVNLTKGDRSSVNVHDARARLSWQHEEHHEEKELLGFRRQSYRTVKVGKSTRVQLDWDRLSANPLLNIIPGEQTQIACYFQIPAAEVGTVEVAVLGKRPWSPFVGLWKASAISLPSNEAVGSPKNSRAAG